MHSLFNGNCPAYLSDIVQRVSVSRPRLHLRSLSSTNYVLPWLHTKFGKRAFSQADPSARNRLPEDIRTEPDIANFRKLIKLTILILCLTFNNYFIILLVMHPWPSCNGRTRNAVSVSMSMEQNLLTGSAMLNSPAYTCQQQIMNFRPCGSSHPRCACITYCSLLYINQSIYLLKLGKITRATEQNKQDSKDNGITDSCPRNVRIWTNL